HQVALKEELAGYEYPARLQAPTFSPCASVILDFGTEDQKQRHLPAILKGDAIWMQLLSEPSGGSDVAAALTTAVRDGEEWVLNNSPSVTIPSDLSHNGIGSTSVFDVARDSGRLHDPVARDLIGEARMLELVNDHLRVRVGEGIATGKTSDQMAAVGRLFGAV